LKHNYNRFDFYPKKNKLTTSNIFNLIHSNLITSKLENNFEIFDISSNDSVRENSIYFAHSFPKKELLKLKNIIFITNDNDIYNSIKINSKLLIENISEVYNDILNFMYNHEDNIDFEDDFVFNEGSYLSKFSEIHNSSKIGKNCIIGRGVKIGKNCIIKNNVVIKNSIIFDNVIICDNTSIGTTGFGFSLDNMGSINLNPQLGVVIIESNVHIGSNCSIDRAKLDYTFIGQNSMIDNQVHIAHNVVIDENACIAAQTGISGSTKIGKNLICGGQVGFAGHINIGNNVIVAAKSGVTKNINDNSRIAGFPAIDLKSWKKIIIKSRK